MVVGSWYPGGNSQDLGFQGLLSVSVGDGYSLDVWSGIVVYGRGSGLTVGTVEKPSCPRKGGVQNLELLRLIVILALIFSFCVRFVALLAYCCRRGPYHRLLVSPRMCCCELVLV